jgi:phospholipid/cholesterol/gamma-HCH transport system substrate-binding protein
MENRAYAIVAVSFLIALSIGAVALYIWLHRGTPTPREYVIVSSYSVEGLQPEAAVKFKGVRVGMVKQISFDPSDPKRVLVRIGVYPTAYISHATYAQISYRGITGQSDISLSLSKDEPDTPLPTNPHHPARIPMKRGLLQALTESGSTDIKHAKEILARIDRLLSADNRQRVADTLVSLNQASRHLDQLEQTLMPTARTLPGLAENAKQVLKRTRALLQRLDRLTKVAQRSVGKVGTAADSFTKAGGDSDKVMRHLMEQTAPELDRLLRRLQRATMNIERLSQQLERQPQSIIFGKSPAAPGPGEPGFQPPTPHGSP